MKLTELEPKWESAYGVPGKPRLGVTFLCPHCRVVRIHCAFENPIDDVPPLQGVRFRWHRTGDTFETLTLSPSVDMSMHGCWHGWIKDGEVT